MHTKILFIVVLFSYLQCFQGVPHSILRIMEQVPNTGV